MKGVLGYFDEVISVTVAIPTSGVVLRMKDINKQRFPQISHKRLQDRLLLRRVFLCFLCLKKRKGILGDFGEVISVTVAIPTSGVGLRMKAINRQRFPQIPHKNLQDRLLLRSVFFHFPCVFFLEKNAGRPWLFR